MDRYPAPGPSASKPEEAVMACPDSTTLELLIRGELALPAVEELTQHLEQCPACVQSLQTLRVEDPLLRILAQLPSLTTPAPAVDQLIQQARQACEPLGVGNGWCKFLADPQEPDELGRLGPYRILKLLGTGGMGIVFEAEDVQLHRRLAVKAINPLLATNPQARQRFLREARSTAQIKHEHIVAVYQVGEDGGVPYLAMELLAGHSLEDTRCRSWAASR